MLISKLPILVLIRFLKQTQSQVCPGEAGTEADWPRPAPSSHSEGPGAACCRRQGNDLTPPPTISTKSPERDGAQVRCVHGRHRHLLKPRLEEKLVGVGGHLFPARKVPNHWIL